MDNQLKNFIKENRSQFEQHTPSQEIENKILDAIKKKNNLKKTHSYSFRYTLAAASIIIVCLSVYFHLSRHDKNLKEIEKTIIAKQTDNNDIQSENHLNLAITNNGVEKVNPIKTIKEKPHYSKKNTSENNNIESTLAKMLNDDQPASSRISGLLAINDLNIISTKLMNQITETATNDKNTNVRLAAIDLFINKMDQPEMQTQLIKTFLQQDDPLVQAELIHIISKIDHISMNHQVTDKLAELTEDPNTMVFVKEQAIAMLMSQER